MNNLLSCVRAKKLLLISDACAAAGFTFFALHPILGVRATKDWPKHPLSLGTFSVSITCLSPDAPRLGIFLHRFFKEMPVATRQSESLSNVNDRMKMNFAF